MIFPGMYSPNPKPSVTDAVCNSTQMLPKLKYTEQIRNLTDSLLTFDNCMHPFDSSRIPDNVIKHNWLTFPLKKRDIYEITILKMITHPHIEAMARTLFCSACTVDPTLLCSIDAMLISGRGRRYPVTKAEKI